MGTQLKNPPVYLTLAQVRFNSVLKMTDKLAGFLPTIQEAFRQAGYPDYQPQRQITFQILQDPQLPPSPVLQERAQFGNLKKTHMFILDSQSLTLQSTDYGHYEKFSKIFLEGLNIVNEAVNLGYTERIGLRYLDRVMPKDGEDLKQYLKKEVHGLSTNSDGKLLHSYTEALNEIGNIKLLSRVAIQDGPLAFPPDLQPGNLTVAERFAAYAGKSAILDNDGFVEEREVFSVSNVSAHLNAIHHVIGTAFKNAATSFAFNAWNQ